LTKKEEGRASLQDHDPNIKVDDEGQKRGSEMKIIN
jgi:hypothetical protein